MTSCSTGPSDVYGRCICDCHCSSVLHRNKNKPVQNTARHAQSGLALSILEGFSCDKGSSVWGASILGIIIMA